MTYFIISVVSVILVAIGVYFLGLYVYKIPTQATYNAIETSYSLSEKQNQTFINKLLGRLSKGLVPMIHLNESKRYKVQTALDYSKYNISAEQHYADSISAAVLIGLMSLFLIVINPVFVLLGLVFAGLIFKLEYDKPIKQMQQIKEDIEFDAPLLCKFISDALKDGNRNVVDILSTSKVSMSKAMRDELETTITDMKTGNQEDALVAMSNRINTSTMIQIVVGLLGILKGNDETLYFDMLYEKLHKNELTMIRKKNSVKPGKISKISMLLIIAIIGQILVGMILSLLQQLGDFGII